jgi:mono/diheme cytochrome c family protein
VLNRVVNPIAITERRGGSMRVLRNSAVVIAASAALVGGTGLAWAQGEWKADAKCVASAKNAVKGVGNAQTTVKTNCETCHGASGKGDGPAAAALPPPKPADWTSAKIQSESDAILFCKISEGRGAMPPWKHLPEKDRWEVVNYIRTLKK